MSQIYISKQIIPRICYQKQIKNFKVSFFFILKNKLKIVKSKQTINKFFNFYKFILIYFFIGNFFIQTKLKKTIKNIINIALNYYQIAKISINCLNDFYLFLQKFKKCKNLNINKSIFLFNFNFYLPHLVLKNNYNYFNILYIYMYQIKMFVKFFSMKCLKLFKFLNDHKKIIEIYLLKV